MEVKKKCHLFDKSRGGVFMSSSIALTMKEFQNCVLCWRIMDLTYNDCLFCFGGYRVR